jgi:glycine/D-amino acid oxidase-like deaminating enzyme
MNGFSGHGFKCAPAFGSMVAQYVTQKSVDTYECKEDPLFFSPTRQPLTMSTKNVMA